MKPALDILLNGFRANWRRATKEILSLLAILALSIGLFAILIYARDLPGKSSDSGIAREYTAFRVGGID